MDIIIKSLRCRVQTCGALRAENLRSEAGSPRLFFSGLPVKWAVTTRRSKSTFGPSKRYEIKDGKGHKDFGVGKNFCTENFSPQLHSRKGLGCQTRACLPCVSLVRKWKRKPACCDYRSFYSLLLFFYRDRVTDPTSITGVFTIPFPMFERFLFVYFYCFACFYKYR